MMRKIILLATTIVFILLLFKSTASSINVYSKKLVENNSKKTSILLCSKKSSKHNDKNKNKQKAKGKCKVNGNSKGKANGKRCAKITNPDAGQTVSHAVSFKAYMIDNDYDPLSWAVRKGGCDAASNTVFGNVNGRHDAFSWRYNADKKIYQFKANTDTCSWDPDYYCFVFNPKEDRKEKDIRLTRTFKVASCYNDKLERTARIQTPKRNEEISGDIQFKAFLVDNDYDGVNWAVRYGSCSDSTATVLGNVNGHQDAYTWKYNDNKERFVLKANANTCEWNPGSYCFVFNPKEDPGEENIRLTRRFTVAACDSDNDGVTDDVDVCENTVADDIPDLSDNRWMWDGTDWVSPTPQNRQYTMEQLKGCSCAQILDTFVSVTGRNLNGQYTHGCRRVSLNYWISGYHPLQLPIDMVEVAARSETAVRSHIVLSSDKEYQIAVEGTADAGDTIEFDAQYSITNRIPGDTWTDHVSGYEQYGPNLLNLKVNGKFVNWGAYNDLHLYRYYMMGNDAKARFKVYDIYYPNNSGYFMVYILERLW